MSWLEQLFHRAHPLVPPAAKVWAAREYLNRRFEKYGTMTNLQIDPDHRTANLELQLTGEKEPVQITIGRYELITRDGVTTLELFDLRASRDWLNLVLAELGRHGKLKFQVPETVKAVL